MKYHVGRRVDVAQRAIDRERVRRHLGLEALRQHHLEDVAGRDVGLCGAHRLLELGLRRVGAHLEAAGRRRVGLGELPAELPLEEAGLGPRQRIGDLERVGLRAVHPGVGDNQDAVLHVVEREHGVEEHEPGVVAGSRLRREAGVPGEGRLEPRRGVVAQEPDRAAREPRQPGHPRRAVVRHQLAQGLEERLRALLAAGAALHARPVGVGAQDEEGVLAEEGVARRALAPLHALEAGTRGRCSRQSRRKADTGVSMSARTSRQTGTTVPWAASAANCSKVVSVHRPGSAGARPGLPAAPPASAAAWRASSRSAASRNRRPDGRRPVHHANCRTACATSISSPPIVSHPAAAASARNRVVAGL